jgi:cell division protein FtsI (penicillin-binding protein 3)
VANPQIVIAVTLIGTSGGSAGYGGPVAAPVFRQVATSGLRMLDVPKDLPDTATHVAKADDASGNDLAIAGLSNAAPLDLAEPTVLTQELEAPKAVSTLRPRHVTSDAPPVQSASATPVTEVTLDRRPFLNARSAFGPKVPDLRGMTLRAVLEESAASGMAVEVRGSGLARAQDPAPGSVLAPGARIRVQFAR